MITQRWAARWATLCFLAIFGLTSATAVAQDASSAADIAFWNSVKDSKSAAEIQAYITKFPNGTFVDLAKLRLSGLQNGSAQPSSPAAATQPAPQPNAPLSAETIRKVQNQLYGLNYDITVRDGRVTQELRDAIKAWRDNTKRTNSGELTAAEAATIEGASLPTVWGAVAYNARGGTSTVWSESSRDSATSKTMEACRKLNGGTCKSITVATAGCAAVSFASGTRGSTIYNDAYAVARPTLAQATNDGLSTCRSRANVANNCGLRTTVCADGSHKK
jgi:Domain of unknown function (DUF4189)